MTSKQVISKILNDGSAHLLEDYGIDSPEYFAEYEDEYNYIKSHYDKWNKVPDKASFLDNFPDFSILDVSEPNGYLVDTLREEKLFRDTVPILQKTAELMKAGKTDDAVEYVLSSVGKLEKSHTIKAVDIFKDAVNRYDTTLDKINNPDKYQMTTGFKELDDVLGGFSKGEELVVIYARLGNGKSFTTIKMLTDIALSGERVGIISPEMGADKIGYRVDTIISHISNSALVQGKSDYIDMSKYKEHVEELSKKSGFIVSTPKDFDNRITVTKIRNYIKQYSLTALAIDGIMYITDERSNRNDNKTIGLTNISIDLKSLSDELGVPIIVVHQSNRGGEKSKDSDSDMPDLINLSHSDGIAQSATKVIALRQQEDKLFMEVQKNRDNPSGQRLTYLWNADRGTWKPIATAGTRNDEEFVSDNINKFDDIGSNVF